MIEKTNNLTNDYLKNLYDNISDEESEQLMEELIKGYHHADCISPTYFSLNKSSADQNPYKDV